jgi:superfamily I DNA/RNA helicase
MAYRITILGRPGTGKTTKILEIYKEMIDSRQYRIEDIVICSFRRSAAMDFKNAIRAAIPWIDEGTLHEQISTIHSQCYRLIAHPKLMTAKDYQDFVKEYGYSRYMKVRNRDTETHRGEWEEVAQSGDPFDLYSWSRNNVCPPEKAYRYPAYSKCSLQGDRLLKFFHDYDEFKRERGKLIILT